MKKALLAPVALLALGLGAGDLHAAQGTPAAPVLSLTAAPIFGSDAGQSDGWLDVVATLQNSGTVPLKGTLELESAPYTGSDDRYVARAPFNVPAGKVATVTLPLHSVAAYANVNLTARGDSVLADTSLTMSGTLTPLLVDVHQPSRITVALRNWPMSPPYNPFAGGFSSPYAAHSSPLAVGAPAFDHVTGDPILPERASGYASVTVLLVGSDTLARLDTHARDAVVDWVLAGGTLAVVPTRPEDLRSGLLPTLAGGAIEPAAVPPVLLAQPPVARPTVPTPGQMAAPPGEDEEPPPSAGADAGGATPIRFVPVKTTPSKTPPARTGPGAALRERLSGYTGGNLQPSAYGATAPYGLGEVHLLAFDPTRAPEVDDAWVHGRLIDLLDHAWDRQALRVFPQASREMRSGVSLNEVRRALDPNESFRPALGIAAILLVLYSIVAGPLTFTRARKQGRPLAPLLWAPLWSVAAFGLIVGIGFVGKGWRGRARHLSLAEAGAGMSHATVRRFRGFFSSQTRSLTVPATDGTCVLDVVGSWGERAGGALRLDRNGLSLEDLTALPWQTVVASEYGFLEMKGSLAITGSGPGTDVENHTGHDLKNVLVHVPGEALYYFPAIKDGAELRADVGRSLLASSAHYGTYAGARMVHAFDVSRIATLVGGKGGDDVRSAWAPIVAASGGTVDWFPDGVPVVLAEVEGGETVKSDSGLSVESDRLLLRVVASRDVRGGTP